MSELNRHCSIVIDGMRIEQTLQYLSSDRIVGFEEKEEGFRSPVMANELLVFMIHGAASPWNQVSRMFITYITVKLIVS